MGILNKITCFLSGLKDEYFTYQGICSLKSKDSNYVGIVFNGKFSIVDLEKKQLAPFKLEYENIVSCAVPYDSCCYLSLSSNEFIILDYKTGRQLKRIQGKYNSNYYLFVKSSKSLILKGGGKCALLDKNDKEVKNYEGYSICWGNGIIMVKSNNKWGVLDRFDGNELLPCRYDNYKTLTDKLIAVEESGKWGVFSLPEFKEMLPCEYDDFMKFTGDMLPVCLNKEWGYIDINTWRVAIPFAYKSVTPFNGDYAGVEQRARWGMIDKSGEKLIKCTYHKLWPLPNALAVVSEEANTSCKVIDCDKNRIYDSYTKASGIKNNKLAIRKPMRFDDYGLLDLKSGKVIVPERYSSVFYDSKSGCYIVQNKSEKWGIYGVAEGYEIVPCKYERVSGDTCNRLFRIKKDGKEGQYDLLTHKEIIPWKYRDNETYLPNTKKYLIVCSKEGKYGLISKKNWKEVVPCECESYGSLSEDIVAFKKNNLWGFFDAEGKHIELLNTKAEIISDDKHSDVIPESPLKLSAETNQKSSNTTPKPAKKEIPAAKSTAKPAATEGKSSEGTRTKYAVNDTGSYGKGRMVEAVVNKYVELNPQTTVAKLKEVFPERLQGSNFIKDSTEDIKDMKRYYESALPNGEKFYISNQWGTQTDGFVEYVNNNVDGITVTKL